MISRLLCRVQTPEAISNQIRHVESEFEVQNAQFQAPEAKFQLEDSDKITPLQKDPKQQELRILLRPRWIENPM